MTYFYCAVIFCQYLSLIFFHWIILGVSVLSNSAGFSCSRAVLRGNFQRRGVLLVWRIVGKGSTILAVGLGAIVLIFYVSVLSIDFLFSLLLGEGSI